VLFAGARTFLANALGGLARSRIRRRIETRVRISQVLRARSRRARPTPVRELRSPAPPLVLFAVLAQMRQTATATATVKRRCGPRSAQTSRARRERPRGTTCAAQCRLFDGIGKSRIARKPQDQSPDAAEGNSAGASLALSCHYLFLSSVPTPAASTCRDSRTAGTAPHSPGGHRRGSCARRPSCDSRVRGGISAAPLVLIAGAHTGEQPRGACQPLARRANLAGAAQLT
jgi:hypothetical protein